VLARPADEFSAGSVVSVSTIDWTSLSLSSLAVLLSLGALALVWWRGRLRVHVDAHQHPLAAGLTGEAGVIRPLVDVAVTVTAAPVTVTDVRFVRADGRPASLVQHPWQLAVPDVIVQVAEMGFQGSAAMAPASDGLPLFLAAGGHGRWTFWVRQAGPIGAPHVGCPPPVDLRPEVTLASGQRVLGPAFPAALVDSTLSQPVDSLED
jgi:hypothetical protein